MKSAPKPPLSDIQLAIMQIVWEHPQVTVAEVVRRLAPERVLARNTVQTMMMRLEAKHWLKHRIEGKTFHYSSVQPQTSTLGSLARRLVDHAFAGSVDGLVLALIRERGISEQERTQLRQLIDASEAEATAATTAPPPQTPRAQTRQGTDHG